MRNCMQFTPYLRTFTPRARHHPAPPVPCGGTNRIEGMPLTRQQFRICRVRYVRHKHGPQSQTHNAVPSAPPRSDQSVKQQASWFARRRVEVLRCHGEFPYAWRSSTTGNTSGDRFRHLRTPVHAHRVHKAQGFSSQDAVAAVAAGSVSARLTSRPEPLALRMSWYGSVHRLRPSLGSVLV